MANSAEILMRLVGNGVFGTPLSMPAGTVMTDELLSRVFDLAKAHDVAHIVASALDKNNLLSILLGCFLCTTIFFRNYFDSE